MLAFWAQIFEAILKLWYRKAVLLRIKQRCDVISYDSLPI